MLGQRVNALRTRHHFSQESLAKMIGMSPSQISLIENNRSQPSVTVVVALAQALGCSVDFLTGLVDDDRRSTVLVSEIRRQATRVHELESGLVGDGLGRGFSSSRGIRVHDTLAGTSRAAGKPVLTAAVIFPTSWLRREGLAAGRCEIIGVVGESMAPTLPDGCSILVNHRANKFENGKVFAIRTADQLLIRRALKYKTEQWLLSSDNPDKKKWPTMAHLAEHTRIIGEVRWVWHSLP